MVFVSDFDFVSLIFDLSLGFMSSGSLPYIKIYEAQSGRANHLGKYCSISQKVETEYPHHSGMLDGGDLLLSLC